VLALVHIAVDFGSWLEFGGMTVAIAWLATYGLGLVVEGRERSIAVGDRADAVADARERIAGEAAGWSRSSGLSESA
jgi:hypothetical protein